MSGRGAQIALLHLVSNYVPRVGLPASPRDKLSFVSKRDITYSAIACANRHTLIFHHIRATVHILTDLDMDAELSQDPNVNLLGAFNATNVGMGILCICKTIYLLVPFVGIFLEKDLTPSEAWTCLCGVVVDRRKEADFRLITYWLHVALTKKVGDKKYPLAMLKPTKVLSDRDLLRHCHNMLTRHLPRMEPTLQRVQGLLIVTHIRGVTVELRQDREAKE